MIPTSTVGDDTIDQFWPPSKTIWERLGFIRHEPEISSMENDPRFAPGALFVVTKISVDWPSRIRLLISGKAIVKSRTITDTPVGVAISNSSFSICAPGEPF